jgi:hypothetical protein
MAPWGPPVSEQRERAGYRFGEGRSWAVGRFLGWASLSPQARFYIFLYLFLFSFSDFHFFHNFCKFGPN